VISCELSLDCYHESIDLCVEEAFAPSKYKEIHVGSIGIRNTQKHSKNVIYAGRAKKIYGADKSICICEDLVVAPNGDVYSCGCKKHKFGNVVEDGLYDKINEWTDDIGVGIGECIYTSKYR